MSIAKIAQACIDDIETKMRNTQEFGTNSGKEVVFTVYSEDDLFDKIKIVKFPAVGIMYEGMRDGGRDPTRQGMAADFNVALVLILDGPSIGGLDRKNEAVRILDVMRDAFKANASKSPSIHKWRFVSEVPAGNVKNLLIYIQRWACPVLLT